MKKVNFTNVVKPVLFCVLLVSLSFCKKEEIPGPKGEPGTNGTGGNSSTAVSDNFLVYTSQWQAGTDAWVYTYTTSIITKKVADEGAVKVFLQKDNAWWELPHADGDLLTQCGFSEGQAKLTYADIHGGLPTKPDNTTFRLVTLYESARAYQEMGTVYPSNVSQTSALKQ